MYPASSYALIISSQVNSLNSGLVQAENKKTNETSEKTNIFLISFIPPI